MAGRTRSKKIECRVQVVPSDGRSHTRSVEVAATGASLREVLKALDIDVNNKNFTVNGRPANLDRHVTQEDVVEARDKPVVQVTERPASS